MAAFRASHPVFGVVRSLPILVMAVAPLIAAASLAPRQQAPAFAATRTEQRSGTTADLVAVSAVGANVAWAVGLSGAYTFTRDGGKTWTAGRIADAESLALRDVHAIDGHSAFVMSVGPARAGRIYKTEDGGKTWSRTFSNIDAGVQWRGMAFWDPLQGVAYSDGSASEFLTMYTRDGGATWTRVPPMTLPAALADERGASGSGTGIVTQRGGRAWFATTKGRVLRSTDFGESWKLKWVPVTRTDSTGVVSLAFRNKEIGIAFGAFAATDNDTLIAVTEDGGDSWDVPTLRPLMPHVSAGAYVPDLSGPTVVAVGARGAAYSLNHARSWYRIDSVPYTSVAFGARSAGWAVGPGGRITKLSF